MLGGGGGAVGDAELAVDVFEVLGDRAGADVEAVRDGDVGASECDLLEDSGLAVGEPAGSGVGSTGQGVDGVSSASRGSSSCSARSAIASSPSPIGSA